TLGDPRGIGPEVTEAALADREIAGAASFVRVGPDALVGPDGVGVGGWTAADGAAAAGRVAGEAIRRAVAMALAGEVDAVVTAPADTVCPRAVRGEFDAVIAPYHDVGMAAFKTAAFGSVVNVTLGLPFPRTSPDHGTALDIAGKGLADPGSMKEAILLAVRLA